MRGRAERVITARQARRTATRSCRRASRTGSARRLAVLVDAGVPDIQHRHAGPQVQRCYLIGPWHPGADFLPDATATMGWFASVTVGYTADGKRIFKRARGRTKTEAQRKLKEIIREYELRHSFVIHFPTLTCRSSASRAW